ncbi:LysR family transcriptional regulator [Nocardia panacis]|uniref:LysR family transcriptional regulator n=1 Tax=Nocardia panacis TaxID=2340916 RepID=A0A3A4KJL3_9NOCA|nr:LysR family transcriptional regulator [Nocardia panacis]RJO74831.1 LysR family transcriptional regulator [Nocardia panacis]
MNGLDSIEVVRLRWFVAVAEELHFARAARELGISRQRLSRSVLDMEDELGVKLFVPGAQPTELTQQGREALSAARDLVAAAATEPEPTEPGALRVGYVPGVTVAKWTRIWSERYPDSPLELVQLAQAAQETALRTGEVDMCFVRLPMDRDGMSAIPLYRERPVAVVRKDHPVSLFDEITLADLSDEFRQDATDLDAAAGALELVAAAGGFAIVPHSIARLHHRRDLVYRILTDVTDTEIALAWPAAHTTGPVEQFVGVVRGRSEQSSRTPQPARSKSKPTKTAAKPARSGGRDQRKKPRRR